jgi:lauroyl/myristoyl acyltransferase
VRASADALEVAFPREAVGAWRALARLIGALPFRALPALGAVLGWLAGSALRIRRAHVEEAMRRAGIAGAKAEAARMYRALGASLFELLWLAGKRAARASEHARFDPRSQAALDDAIDAAASRGVGIVLAASHTGSWELAAAAIAESRALTAVTKRIHAASIDAFVRDARASRGWDAASGVGALARARRAVKRGGVAALMIDQVPEKRRHGVEVDFLGARALADRAPATLAAETGAPLVVVASARDAKGDQVMRVLAVLSPPERGARGIGGIGDWIDRATRDAAGALDAFVREHPSQWLWMHRRWRL